ncbi:MAG TPA: hypothetical protein PLD20_34565 [Blastocatellia bacterium]|nr:hypothetical protein [Blastocatellia bacterium]HMY75840.1 hypothetical protein [Blastocatellia bacterium]HMZ23099.1 hypothetical protein [Blastocatellia bacterium]HNG34874.1 hypothetical protein [Blastocatellia bacterium]
MRNSERILTVHFLVVCLFIALVPSPVSAQTTGFAYQGKLTESGLPASGNYDMQFKLFDALSGGAQQGATVTNSTVAVSAGIFTVTLDFGANVFSGAARYLEIGVRPAGSANPYTLLAPRQAITSSPYAIQTLNAQQLNSLPASRYVSTDAGGNVGIGTATPASQLHVKGTGEVAVRLEGNAASPAAQIETSFAGVRRWTFGTTGNSHPTPNAFYIYQDTNTSNAPIQETHFLIKQGGNVGIGTTEPGTNKLQVEANTESWGIFARNNYNLPGGGGIFGQTFGLNSTGVFGRYDGPAITSGANGWGVFGLSPNGYAGVFGSGGKNGVFGATSHPTESGVYGKNDGTGNGVTGTSANGRGIYGRSDGDGDGVVGETGAANRSGVYGLATNAAGCGGCFQNTAGGAALGATGHAVQSRDGGGLVKAMAYVNPQAPGGVAITRCYNSQVSGSARTTPPCGFTVTHDGFAVNTINFGFQVSDRFLVVTPTNGNAAEFNACFTSDHSPCSVMAFLTRDAFGSSAQVKTVYANGDRTDNPFFILVF